MSRTSFKFLAVAWTFIAAMHATVAYIQRADSFLLITHAALSFTALAIVALSVQELKR